MTAPEAALRLTPHLRILKFCCADSPSSVTDYINLSPSYKNPADSGSNQGAKFTLDSTSYVRSPYRLSLPPRWQLGLPSESLRG
jgi:hypothetical protein